MMCTQTIDRRDGSASSLIVNDLCAQLAPLNSYGLRGLGAVMADSLRALIGASRTAVGAVLTRCEADCGA